MYGYEKNMRMYVKVSGGRILVHVNIVLVDGFHDEFVALFFHGSGHKRSQVQLWNCIKLQLIVNVLVRSLLRHGVLWHAEPASPKQHFINNYHPPERKSNERVYKTLIFDEHI